jgi:type IV pilus assembly protein PilC
VPELLDLLFDTYYVLAPQAFSWAFGLAEAWPTVELGILVVVAGVAVFFVGTYLPGGRALREWLLRRIPGIAQVYWSSVLARFAHTSALAAYSGTPLSELIAASGAASGSVGLARAARRVAEQLEQGRSLEEAAGAERDVPALWVCTVATASGRGELPGALEELASVYEHRAQKWVSTVRMLLGPLLLVFVGVVLGGMIAAIFSIFAGALKIFAY